MDFIDKAIEKQRIRLDAVKAKQKAEADDAEKRDQEIREQVDYLIAQIVLPVVCQTKERFEQKGIKAEVDIEISISFDTGKSYHKGVKLQLSKGLDRRSVVPIVIGPSLYFSAAPPYSTTIAVVAYGVNNNAIFSERLDLTEMTEKLVIDYIKMFVAEVIK